MFWVVEQKNLWGDLGSILISGSAHRESEGGPLLLHRAGPFLPPISFPWLRAGGHRIVVSDDFRRELEQLGLAGLRFERAVKAQIVNLAWHEWDRRTSRPREYPSSGEPGGYIWEKPHDPRAAKQMCEAWEFLPPVVHLNIERLKDAQGGYLDKFKAFPGEDQYPSLFISHDEYGDVVVDDKVRCWFEMRAGEWVQCCEVEMVNAEPRRST